MTDLHWYYLLIGFGWVPALVAIGVISAALFWAYLGALVLIGWLGDRRG